MLDVIQEHLEAIYGVRCEYRARDFLVDTEAALRLGASGRAPEELLVCEEHGVVELALYLAPSLLARCSAYGNSPGDALQGDLGGFCEVAEGVSHFMYMTRSVELGRRVSLLELEAQAEVDKFAVCTLLKWGSDVARWSRSLAASLFERVTYRAALSGDERSRYVEANRLARTYVARLQPLVGAGLLDRLLEELRHSYRLGAEAKLAYFAR